VVKGLHHWSDRQTAEEIATNDLLRWFVGYKLCEATLSSSTLWRFGDWLKEHQPRLLFNEMLKQSDEDFPAEAQAAQVGDTFVLHSRAHEQTRIVMLRCACQTVLQQLAAVTAASHGTVLAALDGSQLFGTEDETPEQWLEKTDRAAREIRTALGAQHCLTLVQAQVTQRGELKTVEFAALQHRTNLLAKLLTDYFVITSTADQRVTCTLRTESVKGAYRIGSTLDEEATFRQHGEHADLGYNINVAATTNFVREINAVTGATPDSVGVALLIANQGVLHIPPILCISVVRAF
jgi:IS5 family transposase